MNFSELIGKKIICLSYAKEIGIVFSCTVDKKLKRINQLITVDEEEDEGFVDFRKVIDGIDVLCTAYTLADYSQNGITFPFRKAVYDTDGNLRGIAEDFIYEQNGAISQIVTEKGELIETERIVIASEDLIVIKGERKIKPRLTKKEKDYSDPFNDYRITNDVERDRVSAQSQTTINENTDAIQPQLKSSNEDSPKKIITGYKFLLGRTVIKHVLSGGKLLIPQGKIIDDETVELARRFGKLVELTVSSIKDNEI